MSAGPWVLRITVPPPPFLFKCGVLPVSLNHAVIFNVSVNCLGDRERAVVVYEKTGEPTPQSIQTLLHGPGQPKTIWWSSRGRLATNVEFYLSIRISSRTNYRQSRLGNKEEIARKRHRPRRWCWCRLQSGVRLYL